MFLLLFQTIIIVYIILMIYHLLDLQKYNYHGILMHVDNKDDINSQMKNLNPILFHNDQSLTIHDDHINLGFDEEYIPLSQYFSDKSKTFLSL